MREEEKGIDECGKNREPEAGVGEERSVEGRGNKMALD